MPARLVSLDGMGDIPLDRAVLLVGRHPRCDARLDSLRVSRLHCCLYRGRGEVAVRDLGSTNGTGINGRPAEEGQLRAGDELSIAHLRYRLEVDQVETTRCRSGAPHKDEAWLPGRSSGVISAGLPLTRLIRRLIRKTSDGALEAAKVSGKEEQ